LIQAFEQSPKNSMNTGANHGPGCWSSHPCDRSACRRQNRGIRLRQGVNERRDPVCLGQRSSQLERCRRTYDLVHRLIGDILLDRYSSVGTRFRAAIPGAIIHEMLSGSAASFALRLEFALISGCTAPA
jgi:hypothetical protein